MELLKELCSIHAPSGNESALRDFLIEYIKRHSKSWKVQPELFYGDDFQDCLILVFGKPRAAVFTHMDSIGFTVRYDNKLVSIGGPVMETGISLVGQDSKGKIETKIVADDDSNYLVCDFKREIDRGTELVFKPDFREDEESVQCCYMDNRLGVYTSLKLCETIENGIICFSCWEEHGGGSVAYLSKFCYEKYGVKQALICDITWVTHGVKPGKGVVLSMRDKSIPRRKFLDKLIALAKESGVPFQLEVEGSGGSDGKELQSSPYPWDWLFIGAAEEFVHSPDEKVNKKDIQSMISMYQYLMEKL